MHYVLWRDVRVMGYKHRLIYINKKYNVLGPNQLFIRYRGIIVTQVCVIEKIVLVPLMGVATITGSVYISCSTQQTTPSK